MRHAMQIGSFGPLLTLFGGTRSSSYVDVEPDRIGFKFGLFETSVERSNVIGACRSHWPWYGGVGWRAGPGTVGLIGSTKNVVELSLHEPVSMRVAIVRIKARRLFVSMVHPEAFLSDLGLQDEAPGENQGSR